MPIDAILNSYDLYYTNAVAAKMGFMLAKGKGGTKLWRRVDERPLPDSYATGDISYANLSPDIQKIIAQRLLHGGIGASEHEVEEDTDFYALRSLRTKDVDTRCRGKAYLGPKIIELNLPTAPTYYAFSLTDGGVENWDGPGTDLDSWDETKTGNGEVERLGGGNQRSGTWCARLGTGATPGTAVISQSIAWHNEYRKHKFTFTAYAWTATASLGTIQIYDGKTTEESSYVAGDSNWHQLTVTHTLAADATELTVKCVIVTGDAKNCYFDDCALTATTYTEAALNTVPCFADFNDEIYGAFGKILAKINAGTWDAVFHFEANITDMCVFSISGVAYLYIALGDSDELWRMVAAETFTEATTECAYHLAATPSTLYGIKQAGGVYLRKTTAVDTWSNVSTPPGAVSDNQNDLINLGGTIYIMKEGSVHYLDGSSDIQEPFPELRTIRHADAGKNSIVSLNRLYFRMGEQQEWEIDGADLTEVTPSAFAPDISEYAYPCVARAGDESWLYPIMKRGAADLAVLAGRWEYIAGSTRWIWHEIRSIDLTDVACAFVSSIEGRPYLYLGSTVSSETVYKVYLPITNDATADSGYRFYTAGAGVVAGSLYSPKYRTLLFAADKLWRTLTARSSGLSSTKYINVWRSVDAGATFTLLDGSTGRLITSPEQTLSYPAAIESTQMNLQFDFVTNADTAGPVLLDYNLKAILMMASVVRFNHTIKCADNLQLKGRRTNPVKASAIMTFIDTIRDEVVTLGDRWGTEHSVKVRVVEEREVWDEERNQPETVIEIEAMKL